MIKHLVLICLPFGMISLVEAAEWSLKSSLIKYNIIHSLKIISGESQVAKGKGICEKAQCEFLLTVEVKSFDSGNTKRDSNVHANLKSEKFPQAVVRLTVPEKILNEKNYETELELELAGIKKKVPVKLEIDGKKNFVHADFKFKCSDFDIERPSYVMMKIEDEVKMTVNTLWDKK